jgi:hypothetical protein
MSRETHISHEKTPREKAAAARRPKHELLADDDELTRELEDSFPASDPPQMTQPNPRPGGPARTKKGRRGPV